MKHIIFGGSFDPIHLGHIEIAKTALKQLGANDVYFVHCKKSENKKIHESTYARKRMLEIAISGFDNFYIDDFEIENDDAQYSYTINLVNHFKKMFPNDELFLLIGNDQLLQFNQWKDYQEILKKVKLVVYNRNNIINNELINKYQAKIIYGKPYYISSTLFKETFDKKLLNSDVYEFIINHGLYHYFLLSKYESDNRLAHSIRVANMMRELFRKHDKSKVALAYIAGLYHDLCKCFDNEHIEFIAYELMKLDKVDWKLLHGPVASYYLYNNYGLKFYEVLNAIARHTKPYDYGSGELTQLDKALFCCDKLEPNRTNQDVENIDYYRDLLNKNIDQCFHELLQAINKQYNN